MTDRDEAQQVAEVISISRRRKAQYIADAWKKALPDEPTNSLRTYVLDTIAPPHSRPGQPGQRQISRQIVQDLLILASRLAGKDPHYPWTAASVETWNLVLALLGDRRELHT